MNDGGETGGSNGETLNRDLGELRDTGPVVVVGDPALATDLAEILDGDVDTAATPTDVEGDEAPSVVVIALDTNRPNAESPPEPVEVPPSDVPSIVVAEASTSVPAWANDVVRRRGEDAPRVADRIAWVTDSTPAGSDRRKLQRLHEVATDLVACETDEAVYELVVEAAEDILAFDICSVDAVEDGQFVPRAVSEGMPEDGYEAAPVDPDGVAGQAHLSGESSVIDDVRGENDADPVEQTYRSALTVPIGDAAVFQAASTTVGAFDATDRELAELLAAHAAGALHRIRSEAAMRRRRETIEQLHEIVAEMVTRDDEDAVYELLVEAAERILDFNVCVVSIPDEAGETMIVRAASDDPLAPPVGNRLKIDESVAGQTYRTKEAERTDSVGGDDVAHPYHDQYGSGISVPLGEIGVAQAISTEPSAFDSDDLELLQLLASQAAAVVTRHRAERRLREERDRLRALFDHVPDPAVSLTLQDGDPLVRAVNPAFESIFGYEGERIIGQNVDDLIVPADARPEAIRLEEKLRAGDSFQREVRRLTADGELRDFLITGAPVTREVDNPAGFAIYTDITDRKRRERELKRTNERLEEFASVVSHDLRTPLSVARGQLHLARQEHDTETLGKVAEAHERMESLVDDLLELARKGEVVGETDSVDVSDAAQTAWGPVGGASAELRLGDPGTVAADRDRLVQLLENLFRNAVEHGAAGDSASVSRSRDSDSPTSVVVSVDALPDREGFFVADDGPGIPVDEREQVLERGYSTATDGTGYGLAIVEEIAAAHGWAISVGESTMGGARFEIQTGD